MNLFTHQPDSDFIMTKHLSFSAWICSACSLACLSMPLAAGDCDTPQWLASLKLDNTQCQKYRTLERDFYEKNDDITEKKRSNGIATQKLMYKPALEDTTISKLAKEWGDLNQKQSMLALKSVQSFKKMLNPEQVKELQKQDDWIYSWYDQDNW